MNDFRDDFYAGYVSGFKQHIADYSSPAIERMYRYYDRKYLPVLRQLPASAAIADIGCGPGFMVRYLLNKGFTRVTGIDGSAEQTAIAREKGLPVITGDALAHLRANPGTYDALLAMDFIEHFTKDELLPLFRAFNRALKPGGLLLLHTPNGEGIGAGRYIYGDLTHCTIFTPNSLTQIMALTGFSRPVCKETGPVAYSIAGTVRTVLWGVIKLIANAVNLAEYGRTQKLWGSDMMAYGKKEKELSGE